MFLLRGVAVDAPRLARLFSAEQAMVLADGKGRWLGSPRKLLNWDYRMGCADSWELWLDFLVGREKGRTID